MCIRIYIFNFKKQQINKQKKTVIKENKRNQRRKENISGKSIKKNKFAAAWGKIFHVTYIPGNKSFFVFFLAWLQKDPDNEDQEGDQEYESVEEEVSQIFVVWCHMVIWGFLQNKWKSKLCIRKR